MRSIDPCYEITESDTKPKKSYEKYSESYNMRERQKRYFQKKYAMDEEFRKNASRKVSNWQNHRRATDEEYRRLCCERTKLSQQRRKEREAQEASLCCV